MKALDIKSALRARFSGQEWAIFFEVADASGSGNKRYADAVAMNLWPSRGLELHGFEIKVSRSDWLSELKNPAKSEPVQKYCDRWWIICPSGIIKPGELPPTWGHYEISDSGQITEKVKAPKLEPIDATRGFIASLLRRAGSVDTAEVSNLVEKRIDKIRSEDKEHIEREIKRRSAKATALLEKVAYIKLHTGIDLLTYQMPEDVASAIKLVIDSGVFETYTGLSNLTDNVQKMADKLKDAMKEMKVKPSR